MTRIQLISYALMTLNDRKNGETLFEILCGELIPKKIDSSFLASSGLAAGGDGGIDGIGLIEGKSFKYAFSINKKWKAKLKSEIDKTNFDRFSILRFFTNQSVPQRDKSKFKEDEKRIAIEIYDVENLIDIIIKDESLGRIIGVPTIANSVTIDYLNRNNQFKDKSDEIGNYLPRKVSRIGKNETDRDVLNLFEYCTDLPKFTILESRAGYGKTCLLKSLHQKILRQEIDLPLPTVFLRLRDYFLGNLRNMIDTGMSVSGDYQVNDVLLILDGFDEIPDLSRINFLKEINQFVNNTPFIRKVILSVRENEYDSYDLKKNGWDDLVTIRLEGLGFEEIRYIVEKSNLNQERRELLLRNELFLSFCDNIFYVVSIIEFYEARANLALGMVELFEFLVEKEVNLLFRSPRETQKIQNELENIALYMTLHQIHKIPSDRIHFFEDLELRKESFEFSHKNIQEYLAARKIAKQPIEQIKGIIAKGDQIISSMTNAFGFLLNLLNSQNYPKLQELIEWSLPGLGNARKLLQIEPDKITPSINQRIFKSVLEQEAKIGNVWEIPSNITTFCTSGGSKEENIQFLVNQLIAKIETNELFYYTLILQRLLNQEQIELNEDQEKHIKLLFLSLLKRENTEEYQERIESLLYVVTKFKRRFMDDGEYLLFKERLLSYNDSDSIFDKFCKLLLQSGIKLSINEYLELLKFIFSSRIREGHQIAGIVPRQITDSNYKLNMFHVKYWESFLLLTESFLAEQSDSLLSVLQFLKENYDERLTNRGSNGALKEYLRHALKDYDFNSLIGSADISIFIKSWTFDWAKLYIIHPIFEIVLERNQKNILFRLIKETIVKETRYEFGMSVFDELIVKAIQTKEDFDLFYDSFHEDNETSIKKRYKSIIHLLETKKDVYVYAKTKTSNLICQEIEEENKNFSLYEQSKNERLSKPKRDYKIAFSFDEVKREIYKIFQVLGQVSVQRVELFDLRNFDPLNEINVFALFLLQFSSKKDEELIDAKKSILKLESLDWQLTYVHFLLQYFYSHSVDINSLDSLQKNKLIEWMKRVLISYPLDKIDNPLKNAHITLAYVLRNLNEEWIPSDFKKEFGDKCLGLVFSGFPNQFMGSVVVSYDSYSLDYLDKVIKPIKIIQFIYENFDHAINHSRIMIGISGYLSNHKDKIIPGILHELKRRYIDYLNHHLNEDYYSAVLSCAYDLGISLIQIDKQLISDSLQIDGDRDDLKHNYAGAFYMYESRKYLESDPEIQHLCDAILDVFLKSEDAFTKKTFAEYYLEMNKSGGEVFQWYSNYLMESDENPISSRLVRMSGGDKIYSRNLEDLPEVEELFLYSRSDNIESDRRRSILEFAIASYKAMGECAGSTEDLQKILESIDRMVENGHEFMQRVKSRIEYSFNERNYSALRLDEIRGMV